MVNWITDCSDWFAGQGASSRFFQPTGGGESRLVSHLGDCG